MQLSTMGGGLGES